jgi:hypothetical protein
MYNILSELKLNPSEKSELVSIAMDNLRNHELFYSVSTIEDLRIYMKYQVWCVWDFMALVKSIQLGIVPPAIIWTPPKDASLGAYIYEILLTEETDINETATGRSSHFETYLRAMDQVGADTTQILRFMELLSSGTPFLTAIQTIQIPTQAKSFVQTTLSHAHSELHIAVAAFCLTREGIIPDMFTTFLGNFQLELNISTFKWYMNRHIVIDNDSHGPLSAKLFKTVVGTDPERLAEALDAALVALDARKALLDAILDEISSTK